MSNRLPVLTELHGSKHVPADHTDLQSMCFLRSQVCFDSRAQAQLLPDQVSRQLNVSSNEKFGEKSWTELNRNSKIAAMLFFKQL